FYEQQLMPRIPEDDDDDCVAIESDEQEDQPVPEQRMFTLDFFGTSVKREVKQELDSKSKYSSQQPERAGDPSRPIELSGDDSDDVHVTFMDSVRLSDDQANDDDRHVEPMDDSDVEELPMVKRMKVIETIELSDDDEEDYEEHQHSITAIVREHRGHSRS